MDFSYSENQDAIRDAIQKICAGFDDAYWLKKDHDGGFPNEFYDAQAELMPNFKGYAEKTTRRIPVVVLDRV